MTTSIKTRSFEQAGWHASTLSTLVKYQCAGMEMTVNDGQESVAKSMVLSYLMCMIRGVIDDPQCWIVAGHEAPQPDTRIIRHKKLWGSFGVRPPTLPETTAEWPVQLHDGLRFFGVIRRDLISEEMLLKLWKDFSTVWVLVTKDLDSVAIQHALAKGWGGSRTGIPEEILRYASEHDIFMIRDFGPTDDFDQGMIVVARDRLIETLAAYSAI